MPPSIRGRLMPQIYASSDLAVIKETKLCEKVIFTTYRSSLYHYKSQNRFTPSAKRI